MAVTDESKIRAGSRSTKTCSGKDTMQRMNHDLDFSATNHNSVVKASRSHGLLIDVNGARGSLELASAAMNNEQNRSWPNLANGDFLRWNKSGSSQIGNEDTSASSSCNGNDRDSWQRSGTTLLLF
ncbi:hypothetical protein Acr_00g0011340 [Actinidia rufa]|uniref:Uncharacterized protein n=1 Tax=Actinidia rufa TaxID=165716 RepID=A0A7J0D9E2_9ERIC|nr:hypothetical protein Acr_00g0011340 [Actinidia rufa]